MLLTDDKQLGSDPNCLSVGDLVEVLTDLGVEFPVDQHEQHPTRFAGSVGPSVVGATFDQKVSGFHQDLFLVQHQGDLPFQHQRVVHRFSAMHEGVFGFAAGVGAGFLFPPMIHSPINRRASWRR